MKKIGLRFSVQNICSGCLSPFNQSFGHDVKDCQKWNSVSIYNNSQNIWE